nr:hypothetical protein [Tanacetum cinerariifolium]GEY84207.1 hypothetical protein [Tanacetum cinerariifolium]
MGYEKPSTKLTFYKAFFSPQWKFLIHTILQCMSAKRISWNEFSSSMASAVICLSTGRKFIFSKAQVGDLSSYTIKYSSPALTQKIFTNMRRVLLALMLDVLAAVEPFLPSPTPTTQPLPPSHDLPSTSQVIPTPPPSLIAEPSSPPQQQKPSQPTHDAAISLDILHTLMETCTTLTRKVKALEQDKWRLRKVGTAQMIESSADTVMDDQEDASKQGEIIANIDADEDVILKDVAVFEKTDEIEKDRDVQERLEESQAQIYQIDLEHADKVLSMQDDDATITAATTPITAATITAAPNKGKGIMVEEPKPLKKQAQIEQDEAYARELEAELNKNINWDDVIEKVQRKEKEDNAVMRYQALKRKPQKEAQARKNMMIYLRNMAGFKMDYFKGMSYDDIRPIFKKYFNLNVAFLEKTKEELEEEESRALKRKTESSKEKAAKKQKLDEEVKELKKHLHTVPNNDDDVYTEATPLALKVPVVDYEIYTENNKPYFMIIRADGTHQLFLSFLSLLRKFDREDLEVLWQLVKERFASSKPKNFSDDFLLTTLTYMFEKPDVEA